MLKKNNNLKKPLVMGIVNITPDSFSDGGHFFSVDKALSHTEQLIKDGVDIIDVGAESTRPGSNSIELKEEISRLEPFLKKYKQYFDNSLSIDTTKAMVAELGLHYGADIINDISAMTNDPNMANIISREKCSVVLMHMQNKPKNMQENPSYSNVIKDIISWLKQRIDFAKKNNIDSIIIDPGIGFGKTDQNNIEIIKGIDQFIDLGYPCLVGTSNKSFLGNITGSKVNERLTETLAVNIKLLLQGVQIIRVHNVKEHVKALKILSEVGA
ncbi:dihydropteroate synthase [Candidatus Marinamargulisbacteria bacterium SCGC AG-410-N11]|nr:dihydropteroate synthase [Candidatus Marinamargulisbacteria bacterium SCGC AG-410-N11]